MNMAEMVFILWLLGLLLLPLFCFDLKSIARNEPFLFTFRIATRKKDFVPVIRRGYARWPFAFLVFELEDFPTAKRRMLGR